MNLSPGKNEAPVPASAVVSFHQLSALLSNGRVEALNKYEGRVCLVVNMATADTATIQELRQLNDLVNSLGPRGLSVLVFPCNQFGGLEPYRDDEIPLILRHVRPGAKFEPLFQLFAKSDVNGSKANPVYEFLKLRQPQPINDSVIVSRDRANITWQPVTRYDIGWNYEKFIVNYDGQPVKRYTHKAPIDQIRKDIETCLRKIPKAVREHLGLQPSESQFLTFR